MTWGKCFIHAIFSVGGYVFFGVATVGALMHLYLQKHESPDKTGKYFEVANQFRYRMNCAELIIGFLLSLIGFILGMLQAKSIWGNFLTDAKTISAAIILAYYALVIGIIVKSFFKKSERTKRVISIMVITGAAFIIVNILALVFLVPTMHK